MEKVDLEALQGSRYLRARYKAWAWIFRAEDGNSPEDAAMHASTNIYKEENGNRPVFAGDRDETLQSVLDRWEKVDTLTRKFYQFTE